ncbi:universal stress protein [Natronomonas amylolytica]|uniref:universal stress protein n=1 Tax=Natronomonas amylolytica TaxID=3108498 RepID=UPI00300882A2
MTRVLVPVEILEGGSVSYGLMNLLGTMDVTVLGYHVLPEQTPTDQAREQFEERAVSGLEDLAEEFREAGGDAESRLVFTHDREQTVDRVANDVDARAYAITGATGDVGRLLVPIAGDVAVNRILDFVIELVGDRDITVTLFLASEADGADALLEEAAGTLEDADITTETELVVSARPFDALIDAVPGHDAIVIGEEAPSLSTFLRGDEAERIASASVGPVLVVRGEQTAAESLGE